MLIDVWVEDYGVGLYYHASPLKHHHIHNSIPSHSCPYEELLSLPGPSRQAHHLTCSLEKKILASFSQFTHQAFCSYVRLVCDSISHILAPENSPLISLPTCINTDKGAFGNVIQAADTPALVLCLE